MRTARLMAAVEGDLPFIILADENGSIPERTKNAGRVTPEMGLSDSEWQIFAEGAEKVAAAVRKKNWPAHGLPSSLRRICGNTY